VARIATVFFISIYGLAAIAGLMLAYAEGSPFPAVLTPALALVAYVLTDRTHRFHLPVLWANVLGLLAFLYAGREMFGSSLETRLLAGAHTVVYLTWIVLFQEKRTAQYWWMCALSVLQAAIGSILTISSSYGGMLVGFMFAAIWTLSLLSLYQAYLQYGESDSTAEKAAKVSALNRATAIFRGRRSAADARTLFLRRSAARGTIQLDPDERWLGARFAFSMLGVSSAALVVATGFFLFIPRLWAGRTEWGTSESKQFSTAAMSGFTSEIRLGSMVPLLENSKRVLQVELFDRKGDKIDVAQYCAELGYAEPLFRGATMETYENGSWTGIGHQTNSHILYTRPSRWNPDYVRQRILMEAMGTPILFAIHPIDALRIASAIEPAERHPVTNQLFRPDSVPSDKALAYDVYSFPAAAGREIRGHVRGGRDASEEDVFRSYKQLPGDSADSETSEQQPSRPAATKLPQLVKLARKVTGYDPERPPAVERKDQRDRRYVELLAQYLRDSGIYRYSLEALAQQPGMDPLEDFLINRKAGHCEYFASALALMLRAVDVPSRVVSGFKGGTVNSLSGAFEVEQRHAHAWVEAYIENGGVDDRSEWIVVDPTPKSRDVSVESFAPRIRTAHDLASVVSSAWTEFVVGMDINAQQSAFYVPILNAVRNWWNPPRGSRPLLARFIADLVDFVTDPTQWFTPTGLVALAVLWAIVAGIVVLVRMRGRIARWLRSLWKPRRTHRDVRIAFYERFEKLCTHLGLSRSNYQTQREFAGTVGPRIRQVTASADGLPDFPPRLAEFFYRARFGEEHLPSSIIDEIDRDLSRLEQAVRSLGRK
jgi:protein-glutamine gamma-glutamyltransferase